MIIFSCPKLIFARLSNWLNNQYSAFTTYFIWELLPALISKAHVPSSSIKGEALSFCEKNSSSRLRITTSSEYIFSIVAKAIKQATSFTVSILGVILSNWLFWINRSLISIILSEIDLLLEKIPNDDLTNFSFNSLLSSAVNLFFSSDGISSFSLITSDILKSERRLIKSRLLLLSIITNEFCRLILSKSLRTISSICFSESTLLSAIIKQFSLWSNDEKASLFIRSRDWNTKTSLSTILLARSIVTYVFPLHPEPTKIWVPLVLIFVANWSVIFLEMKKLGRHTCLSLLIKDLPWNRYALFMSNPFCNSVISKVLYSSRSLFPIFSASSAEATSSVYIAS